MEPLKVKIINRSRNQLPAYSTPSSAGMDLRADIPHRITLYPDEKMLVPTGLFLEIPDGYEAQVRPRSGLAIKHGVTVLNAPGTVDADYRGEVKVILINLGNEAFAIEPGDRIAQMVFARYEKALLVPVETIDKTQRGEGGFGHTGKD